MRRTCVWAALLGALFACKSGTPAPAALPDTCSSDSECFASFKCDLQMRRCVCTGDSSCSNGQFCNAYTGQCVAQVAGCPSTVTCASGQYCDTAVRTCKALTASCGACGGDAECGAGSACVAHPDFPTAGTFCAATCPAAGCSAGLSCKAAANGTSYCFPATACGKSNTCVADSLKLCKADSDCGDPAQACDATLGACVAAQHSCPAGDACDPQSHLCVQACASDKDCAVFEGKPGYQCRNNACFARALCQADGDCTAGQICQQNPDGSKSCAAGCVLATDCPLSQACNTADPSHPRCTQGCAQDTDCPLNAVCLNNACATTTPSCSTLACQTTSVCPIGATCVSKCCVGANLASLCPEGSACTNGTGCAVNCNSSSFPMNIGPCNVQADCHALPNAPADVVCNFTLHECQVLSNLQPCSSAANCPQKGFQCTAYSQFGCGNSGGVCFPQEQSAQAACAAGHP